MKKLICFLVVLIICIPCLSVSALGTSAKAAILINGDTGEVIYEQNADQRLPMASTTKIMTALLLCENGDFDREITVTAEMLRVEGSSMGLLAGDKVTLHDLLYGMMLASGNDAANVTAYVLGGTVDGFVKMMNEKAAELGLSDTHFETPSGLDGDTHYTTARNLAALAQYAMQNEAFAEAASSKTATLNYGNPPYKRTLSNHNKLLKSFDGAVGIKTGYTKKSGRCLVSAAKRDGKFVIAVTLSDPNDWSDHASLLEYGLNAVQLTEVMPETSQYDLAVVGAEQKTLNIEVEPATFSSLNNEEITCQINLPQFVYAPVAEGETLGSVIYKKGDNAIKEVPLRAVEEIMALPVEKKFSEEFKENLKYIFLNLWEK